MMGKSVLLFFQVVDGHNIFGIVHKVVEEFVLAAAEILRAGKRAHIAPLVHDLSRDGGRG